MVALGLGSNVGDREKHLTTAVRALAGHLTNLRISSPYRTRPLCTGEQPDFLNAALIARWSSDPGSLLGLCKGLEWAAGRRPGPRNAPRPLDIDILLFGGLSIELPELVVPHPRLRERQFVLAPLAEIGPELEAPPDGALIGDLLAALPVEQGVEKLTWARSPG